MLSIEVTISPKAIESRARRLAARCGLRMHRSRRRISYDNAGDFMLVDNELNVPVGGFRYDWTAGDVIEYCESPE